MSQPFPDDATSSTLEEEKFFAEMMAQVQSQFSGSGDCTNSSGSGGGEAPDVFLERLMQEMQSQMQSDMQRQQPQQQPFTPATQSPAKKESKPKAEDNKHKQISKSNHEDRHDGSNTTKKAATEVDQAIANLLEDMAKKSNEDDIDDAGENDDIGDDDDEEAAMLRQLMQGLGGLGGGGGGGDDENGDFLNNADAMIDGMMEQLMSKDLMYEPMKQVTVKFPQWLAERKTVLSADEYEK